jgi:hypothetical protein
MSQGTDAGRPEGAGAEEPRAADDGEPTTLAFTRVPDFTLTSHLEIRGAWSTGITHVWLDRDASRCGRCPASGCTAIVGICSFQARGKLTKEQAEAASPESILGHALVPHRGDDGGGVGPCHAGLVRREVDDLQA